MPWRQKAMPSAAKVIDQNDLALAWESCIEQCCQICEQFGKTVQNVLVQSENNLGQCWSISVLPYGIASPQWGKPVSCPSFLLLISLNLLCLYIATVPRLFELCLGILRVICRCILINLNYFLPCHDYNFNTTRLKAIKIGIEMPMFRTY